MKKENELVFEPTNYRQGAHACDAGCDGLSNDEMSSAGEPCCSVGGILASLAGVKLSWDEANAPRVKTYNSTSLGAFSASVVFFGLTPRFVGTVFSRISLWMEVLVLEIFGTLVFMFTPDLVSNRAKWGDEPAGIARSDTFQTGTLVWGNLYINQILQIVTLLYSLLVSRYVFMVIRVHWIGARGKRGDLIRSTSKALNIITTYYSPSGDGGDDSDYSAHREEAKVSSLHGRMPSGPGGIPVSISSTHGNNGSRCQWSRRSNSISTASATTSSLLTSSAANLAGDEGNGYQRTRLYLQGNGFGQRMRQLLRCGPYLAVRYLSGMRGAELGAHLVSIDACSVRDWRVLEKRHKHYRMVLIYREVMKIVRAAHESSQGALREMSHDVFAELLQALVSCNIAACAMLSSVNPQKATLTLSIFVQLYLLQLPFAYVQLIQWGSRTITYLFLLDFSLDVCELSLFHRARFPFTCAIHDVYGCSSIYLIGLWVVIFICGSLMIGLLELHGAIENLYASNCGPVQTGFLRGIDEMTRGLVREETLETLAEEAESEELLSPQRHRHVMV